MAENLDILNTAVSLLTRAVLLPALFSEQVRERSLKGSPMSHLIGTEDYIPPRDQSATSSMMKTARHHWRMLASSSKRANETQFRSERDLASRRRRWLRAVWGSTDCLSWSKPTFCHHLVWL